MKLEEQSILFLTRTMGQGGTENVILQLCEILKPHVKKIVVCSRGGMNVACLEHMGIRHYTIPDLTQKQPAVMWNIYKTLRRIVKKENITVLHSHHRMAAFYAQWLSGKKIRKVANAHNVFYDKKRLTRYAYRNTQVIAVGQQVKKNLVDYYGLQEQMVAVIFNAVKPFSGTVEPVEELENARKQGYIRIGNVGRLSEQKGMEYFIQAAAAVYAENPAVRFFIVGDGEDRKKLEDLAKQVLPDGILSFLGFRPDVQNVMAQLDFVVLSSLWEGFPLTPIEAFSVGKTIVATAVDGTPEIVKDSLNGLLVERENVPALAQAMLRLCNDQELRKNMERSAEEDYQREFSFEQLGKRYVDYYHCLLKGKTKDGRETCK